MTKIVFLAAPGQGQGIRNAEMLRRMQSLGCDLLPMAPRSLPELIVGYLGSPRVPKQLSPEALYTTLVTHDLLSRLSALRDEQLVVHAETSMMGHAAKVFAEASGTPYVLDLHGLWGAECLGNHHGRAAGTAKYLAELESDACRGAQFTIVVSTRMKDYITSNYGISASKVVVIPNGGFATSRFAHFSAKLALVYGGSFAYWERPQDFVGIGQVCTPSEFDLILLGGGAEERNVYRAMRRTQNTQIAYRGRLTREQALDVFVHCQVGVAPSSADLARQVAWPIKVMDYMSCGLPVIAPRVGEWSRMVEASGAGLVTDTSDPSELCAAARHFKDEKAWTMASRAAIETIAGAYTWNKLTAPLEMIYDSVI